MLSQVCFVKLDIIEFEPWTLKLICQSFFSKLLMGPTFNTSQVYL